ncbi:MAG: phosphoribosylformylglycinamidine cyclo-ligase [Fimbriimonadaceae bacterium]
MSDEGSAYAAAGVDIEAAQRALRSVQDFVTATHGPQVLSGVGGFGGMFEADLGGMSRPVLVSSVDGVGTKTKVAAMVGDYSGIGHDIVNHCVNDVLCQGARPLFFLDYFGCSRLDAAVFSEVVTGAAEACYKVGCALIGGETAEMPGVYHDGETDIVGCIVGVVDYDLRLPRNTAKAGDRIVGIASDGLHTNGYSLARRALFEIGGLSVRDKLQESGVPVGEALLVPHRCYYESIKGLLGKPELCALAHVTGGGLYDNLPRVLPSGLRAVIEKTTWTPPEIFRTIARTGNVAETEMYRAFNMGVGMLAVVEKDSAEAVVRHLELNGERAAVIGELQPGSPDVVIV